jgi:hypothetical protein
MFLTIPEGLLVATGGGLHRSRNDPRWRQVMRLMGGKVTYALSPQAKGKIERP